MSDTDKIVASVDVHKDIPDNFPMSRMLHCHNVGLRMYFYAKKHMGWPEEKCHDMYILGMMHDLGYELNADPFEHDEAMARALGRTGYKYIKEIYYHSRMQTKYDSPEMRLLYFGDMTVDGKGNWVTLEDRLKDLEERHGKNSEVYKESKEIADALVEWGFDDSVTPEDRVERITDYADDVKKDVLIQVENIKDSKSLAQIKFADGRIGYIKYIGEPVVKNGFVLVSPLLDENGNVKCKHEQLDEPGFVYSVYNPEGLEHSVRYGYQKRAELKSKGDSMMSNERNDVATEGVYLVAEDVRSDKNLAKVRMIKGKNGYGYVKFDSNLGVTDFDGGKSIAPLIEDGKVTVKLDKGVFVEMAPEELKYEVEEARSADKEKSSQAERVARLEAEYDFGDNNGSELKADVELQ